MNNFLEFIKKDIDGKKEIIGTLPVKTKVNKRNYNETLEMMSTKYKSYKENVYKYLSVKAIVERYIAFIALDLSLSLS